MRPASRVSLVVKLVFTILVLAAVYFIGRVGLADFMRLEPTTYIDQIKEGKVKPSLEKLAVARERLLLARKVDPNNPVIPEYLGQVAFIRAQYASFDASLRARYLEESLREYRYALAIRPNSGYLWAAVMVVLDEQLKLETVVGHQTEDKIQVLFAALRHSVQLAPWERGVVLQVLQVGKRYVGRFDADTRKLFESEANRAQQLGLKVE